MPPSPKPVGVREVCLEGNNRWAASAGEWIQHRDAAKKHAAQSQADRDKIYFKNFEAMCGVKLVK